MPQGILTGHPMKPAQISAKINRQFYHDLRYNKGASKTLPLTSSSFEQYFSRDKLNSRSKTSISMLSKAEKFAARTTQIKGNKPKKSK